MTNAPSGLEVDNRMTEAILKLKALGMELEAKELERAQKKWREIRAAYSPTTLDN